MAILSDYVSGSFTVAANATSFTGTGTGWLAAGFREGDLIYANGYVGVIATITSNTAGTLTAPWRGGALTAQPYRMRYMGDGERVSAQTRTLVELIASGNVEAFSGLTGAINQIPYFTGAGTMGLLPSSTIGRALLNAANGAAAYNQLGIVPDAQMPLPVSASTQGISDADAINANGWYTLVTPWSNGAVAANHLIWHMQNTAGSFAMQRAYRSSSNQEWVRWRPTSSWGPWRLVTAAAGTNANGTFVTFADGTQLCYLRTVAGSSVPAGSGIEFSWTYPSAFTSAPVVVGTGSVITSATTGIAAQVSLGTPAAPGLTSTRVHAWNGTSVTLGSLTLSMVAVGIGS